MTKTTTGSLYGSGVLTLSLQALFQLWETRGRNNRTDVSVLTGWFCRGFQTACSALHENKQGKNEVTGVGSGPLEQNPIVRRQSGRQLWAKLWSAIQGPKMSFVQRTFTLLEVRGPCSSLTLAEKGHRSQVAGLKPAQWNNRICRP